MLNDNCDNKCSFYEQSKWYNEVVLFTFTTTNILKLHTTTKITLLAVGLISCTIRNHSFNLDNRNSKT